MKMVRCVGYLAAAGAGSFLLGRLAARYPIPFRAGWRDSFAWERGGRVYEKLGIRFWQARLPDMSRILPGIMPEKRLAGRGITAANLERMLRETVVAEAVHGLLILAGLVCVPIWPGLGGWAFFGLFALGNLPFILIQRYNRPRLLRLYEKQKRKERRSK